MSELDRAPLIRLQIDQEVFQDAVRDADVIEDATVATEVTSFERVGDAYVLEGAIVFAGYINHTDPESSTGPGDGTNRVGGYQAADSQAWDALSMGFGDTDVQHLHNRLPFVLRVPVKSQPRGIVNVASRISAWQLETVSAGWLRVIADLSIVGLSGDHGYHFECGSQEYGDVFFHASGGFSERDQADDEENHVGQANASDGAVTPAKSSGQVADPVQQIKSDEADVMTENELDLQLMRGAKDADVTRAVHARESREDPALEAAEAVSVARGGAGDPASDSGKNGIRNEASNAGTEQPETARRELESLDKAYAGRSDHPSDKRAPTDQRGESDQANRKDSAVPGKRTSTANSRGRTARGNVVEFDFEHQVNSDELRQADPADDSGYAEADVGVRKDIDSTRKTGDATSVAAFENEDETDIGQGVQTNVVLRGGETEEAEDAVGMPSELWSFVDFNSPEQMYTLRYVIVSEEENLDSVADRIGVRKSDLLRANPIAEDIVHPGQTLAVPVQPAR